MRRLKSRALYFSAGQELIPFPSAILGHSMANPDNHAINRARSAQFLCGESSFSPKFEPCSHLSSAAMDISMQVKNVILGHSMVKLDSPAISLARSARFLFGESSCTLHVIHHILTRFSGDGHVDAGEECDLGALNGQPGQPCDKSCKKCAVPVW